MTTAERLHQYYDFDREITSAVSDTAAQQNQITFESLAYRYGVDEGPKIVSSDYDPSAKLEILEFMPAHDYDETVARIYHLPMANSISPNMVMRGIRLFGADSSQPLIMVGNPAGPGKHYGRLSLSDSNLVWKHKDIFPTNVGIIEYLARRGITKTSQLGYSYGADKAANFMYTSALISDCEIDRAVLVEPAAIKKRSLAALAISFAASNAELQNYIDQTDSKPYQIVRNEENVLGLVGYTLGLLRASNLAIARSLADDGFYKAVENGVEFRPELKVVIGWGDESEITNNQIMHDIVKRLITMYSTAQVQGMRLSGMHHAGGDDIDLHAAIMLQGLK